MMEPISTSPTFGNLAAAPKQGATMTAEELEAIRDHLFLDPPVQGIQRKSSFMGALIDTRRIGNRDPDTGKVREGVTDVGGWMPAIGYLILLDQIGSCFKAPGCAHPEKRAPFMHALQCFSALPQAEIDALYAVRCALAHDYSLFNKPQSRPNPALTHAFKFAEWPTGPVVQLRQTQWTGEYASKPPRDQQTRVNFWALGDLVEGIVGKLRALLASAELGLRLPLDEFKRRYFMEYPDRP